MLIMHNHVIIVFHYLHLALFLTMVYSHTNSHAIYIWVIKYTFSIRLFSDPLKMTKNHFSLYKVVELKIWILGDNNNKKDKISGTYTFSKKKEKIIHEKKT